MKFIRPIFYALIAAASLYLIYAEYMNDETVEQGAQTGLTLTYVLGGIAILACLVFPVLYMIQHPKQGLRALIGVVALVAIFGIGYAMAGNEILLTYERVGFTSPSGSKFIGGALIMTYILVAVSLATTVFSEVIKLFK